MGNFRDDCFLSPAIGGDKWGDRVTFVCLKYKKRN